MSYLKYVLEAAVKVDGAVGGILQLLDEESGTLRLYARHGFSDEYADAVDVIELTAETTCAQAARDRRQVVVRDVLQDEPFAPYLRFAELGQFRSVQSTPMIDTGRRLVGVLTTQYSFEHHPGRDSLQQLDACARVAARVVEAARLHESVLAADRGRGIPARLLSAAGAQAADAARMLMTALPRAGGLALLDTAERHLGVVIDELNAAMRPAPTMTPLLAEETG